MGPQDTWKVRHLDDEPLYCEAPHDEADVLYAGSDDEYYDSPDARKLRIEQAAIRFLQGHTPVLLTTVLRGASGIRSRTLTSSDARTHNRP
ncbi:hypothetical protein CH063_14653 [Colletotrichum higginsianum]|uniref:Uncharacterized protein n=1 Tax=Colletotrichum higginsianum (strain IMI 349063) TaxID=759273 RepID=H1VZH1_COLHI|nr:hypothetical protein CH063_14653 [Colletotrichum higginsianum]